MAALRYYVEARADMLAVRQNSAKTVHLRDCRYLEGPVMEVQYLAGKPLEQVRLTGNACSVCIGSKRAERQGAEYSRQKTVKD